MNVVEEEKVHSKAVLVKEKEVRKEGYWPGKKKMGRI